MPAQTPTPTLDTWAAATALSLVAVGLIALTWSIVRGARRGVLSGPDVRRPPALLPGNLTQGEAVGTGLILILGAMFCYVAVGMAAINIAVWLFGAGSPTPDPILMTAGDAVGRLLGGVAACLFLAANVSPNRTAGLGWTTAGLWTGVRAGIVGFFAVWPVCFLLLLAAVQIIPPREHQLITNLSTAGSAAAVAVLIAAAVPVAAVSEEVFFRGLVQSALRDALIGPRGGAAEVAAAPIGAGGVVGPTEVDVSPPAAVGARWAAILLTSLVFALAHVPLWHGLPALFALSVCMGLLLERTGSLAAPITVHVLFNALNVALSFGRV